MSTLDPSLTLVSQTREPADDVDAIARLAARGTASPGALLDPATDPAVAAALEEIVMAIDTHGEEEHKPAHAGDFNEGNTVLEGTDNPMPEAA